MSQNPLVSLRRSEHVWEKLIKKNIGSKKTIGSEHLKIFLYLEKKKQNQKKITVNNKHE